MTFQTPFPSVEFEFKPNKLDCVSQTRSGLLRSFIPLARKEQNVFSLLHKKKQEHPGEKALRCAAWKTFNGALF